MGTFLVRTLLKTDYYCVQRNFPQDVIGVSGYFQSDSCRINVLKEVREQFDRNKFQMKTP